MIEEVKEYYHNGQPRIIGRKVDGKYEGDYMVWNPDGELQEHSFYRNNLLHGEFKSWYGNGQMRLHCFLHDGMWEGEYKTWNSLGQLEIHCFYREDIVHGEYKEWDFKGELQEHSFYRNGVDITKEALKYVDNDVMFELVIGIPRC